MLDLNKLNNIIRKQALHKKGNLIFDSKYNPAINNEWFNSVYVFNKNTQKLLPSIDVYVSKLIRSYFNMFSKKLETGTSIRRVRIWKRRLRTNRILVAKPYFKHTNDTVTITLHVYNRQLINYLNKVKMFKPFLSTFIKNKDKLSNKYNNVKTLLSSYTRKLSERFTKINKLNFNTNLYKNVNFNIHRYIFFTFIKKILTRIKSYLRLKRLILSNINKFNSIHIIPLKNSLETIYGKRVEFNIVNLQSYNLNSSILTQILTLKLRNRKNRLSNIVNIIVNNVKVPFTSVLEYRQKITKNKFVQNSLLKNLKTNVPSTFTLTKNNDRNILYLNKKSDKLDIILGLYYPSEHTINEIGKIYNKEQMVLNLLSNKAITGIRIEASGRLSKRLIASRAIFKMKQVGTIKNINSSYKEISSVLLRGNFKSNTQYSRSNHRTSIGAFGLKGWISSI